MELYVAAARLPKTSAIRPAVKPEIKLDEHLLESIYRQYYKNVYNYVCFRINNHFDAEDLVSLVFEKAINNWGKYNANLPAEAWLIGIAKNVCVDYFRKNGRRRIVGLDSIIHLISPAKQPEEVAVINDEHKLLISAMAQLSDLERQILSMRFATDLKNAEIATILGHSDSKVRVTAHRAIKKLKKIMEEDGQ